MFDRKDAVYRCDFCKQELNKTHYIYSEVNERFPTECCRTCLIYRKDSTVIKNKKRFWR